MRVAHSCAVVAAASCCNVVEVFTSTGTSSSIGAGSLRDVAPARGASTKLNLIAVGRLSVVVESHVSSQFSPSN